MKMVMPDFASLKNTKGWMAQKHDKPFYMVQGINKPHAPFVVPQEFFDMYPLESIVLPEMPTDDWSDIPASVLTTFLGKGDQDDFAKLMKTKDGLKQVVQAYMASISFCDWVIGEILDSLDASAYAKNTIIILWSDHGYHLGEKKHFGKRTLWSQAAHMPFMVSLPGMAAAGKNCSAPVSLLDVYPTLNELCNLDQKVPQKLSGRSIVPLLKNPDVEWPFTVLTSHGEGNATITDARYHYIRYADGSEELYDHQKDPREFTNLAKTPELKAVVARLSADLPSSWVPTAKTRKKGKKGDDD